MALDRAQVEHLATLARIGLTEEEVAMFQEQLSDILEQFDILGQLDTAGVTATGHIAQQSGNVGVMRDDVPGDSLEPEEVLSNAPRPEGEFFRVKAVLEE